jgi:hypothetical protein
MSKIQPYYLLLIILCLFGINVLAQSPPDSTRNPLTISGAIDAYYRYDFARTASNDLTAFTHSHNEFNLGMANIKVEHKTSRVDMVADLAVGPREQAFAYNDKGITQSIKQLYISYSPTPTLKFTAGTWATHLCYESADAVANRNYSMSYLFSSDPFSHTGIKAEYTLGANSFMIGIANPSDFRNIPDGGHNNKNILAQYSYSLNTDTKFSLNYVGGGDPNNDHSQQLDLVVTARTGSRFSLGFNGTVNHSSLALEKYTTMHHWWGTALFANLDPKPWLGLTLRTEYFNDEQGIKLPASANIVATTLSVNLKIDGLTVIPEFRVDQANKPIFFHADGSPSHAAGSFLIAAVYAF